MIQAAERYFEFEKLGTNWRTEILAGATTFAAMAYIAVHAGVGQGLWLAVGFALVTASWVWTFPERKGEALRDHMKARAKDLGLKNVRINNAGCLDRCELGPTLVIYPEGVWYSVPTREDIDEVLQKHLVEGGRVERLMLRTDGHSPPRFRVAGVIANMPEFSSAFSCPAGRPLLSESRRANIALLENNARFAAQIARALARRMTNGE